VQQLKDEVLLHKLISHHAFVVTSRGYWQSKGCIYHRKLYARFVVSVLTQLPFHLVTDYFVHGELFHNIKRFSQKLIQLYVAECAIVIGKRSA